MNLPIEYERFSDLITKGVELFGEDRTRWRFTCPFCKGLITVQDWIDYAGSIGEANKYIGYECIGRLIGQKQSLIKDKDNPIHKIRVGNSFSNKRLDYCNYRTCSLFDLNPVFIKESNGSYFQFAPLDDKE